MDRIPKTECYIWEGMLWNSLPTEIKASELKAIFKRKLARKLIDF